MAAEVLVRHCTLTVRGRGGWGWGTDCSGYLAAAVPAIEQALEQVLRECDIDSSTDVRIEQPMLLTWGPGATMPDEVRQALVDAVGREAENAGALQMPSSDADPVTSAGASPPDASFGPSSWPGVDGAFAVAALLAGWSQSGRLRQIVASWPTAVASRWVDAVRLAANGPERTELSPLAVSAIAKLVLAEERWPAGEIRSGDRLLVLVGALEAAAGATPIGPVTLEQAVTLVFPAAPEHPRAAATQPPTADRSHELDDVVPRSTHPPEAHRFGVPRRVIAPGLPFLVLVQLGRIGYLDALVAVAAASRLPEAANVFAAGVAGKVLPPPERGWRRHRTEVDAVAAASGLAPGDIDGAAHAMRAELEAMVPPLDSALTALYAAGRSTADEVVVTTAAEGTMCGEADGGLPIAWLPEADGLARVLDQLGGPPMRYGDVFAPLMGELATRSAFPHLDVPDLESHAGVVVGAALGSLAQGLWGVDLPNAPLLALERLADLEVELRLDEVLAVAIPRGQRWLDLGRAGLIDRWAVPWAQGGYWELVSW